MSRPRHKQHPDSYWSRWSRHSICPAWAIAHWPLPRWSRSVNAEAFIASPLKLTQHESLVALFDNRTWYKQGVAEEFEFASHPQAWKHPQVSVFITLLLFIVMKVRAMWRSEPNVNVNAKSGWNWPLLSCLFMSRLILSTTHHVLFKAWQYAGRMSYDSPFTTLTTLSKIPRLAWII